MGFLLFGFLSIPHYQHFNVDNSSAAFAIVPAVFLGIPFATTAVLCQHLPIHRRHVSTLMSTPIFGSRYFPAANSAATFPRTPNIFPFRSLCQHLCVDTPFLPPTSRPSHGPRRLSDAINVTVFPRPPLHFPWYYISTTIFFRGATFAPLVQCHVSMFQC